MRANCRIIHLADYMQAVRRRKRFARQSAWCNKVIIKVRAGLPVFRLRWSATGRIRRGELAALGGVHSCHARIFGFRKADPEIEIERSCKIFLPVIRQRLSGDSANDFIEKKSKRARVVTVRGPGCPQWFLRLKRANHCVVVEHVDWPI